MIKLCNFRRLVHIVVVAWEGPLNFVFCNVKSLGPGGGVIMVCLSTCSQAASGTIYGVVPHVAPRSTGSIAGIVRASAGGQRWCCTVGLGFRSMSYNDAFVHMGSVILGSSLLSAGVIIKGQSGLICCKASVPSKVDQTMGVPAIPEQDTEDVAPVENNKKVEETSSQQPLREAKDHAVEKAPRALCVSGTLRTSGNSKSLRVALQHLSC